MRTNLTLLEFKRIISILITTLLYIYIVGFIFNILVIVFELNTPEYLAKDNNTIIYTPFIYLIIMIAFYFIGDLGQKFLKLKVVNLDESDATRWQKFISSPFIHLTIINFLITVSLLFFIVPTKLFYLLPNFLVILYFVLFLFKRDLWRSIFKLKVDTIPKSNNEIQ